MKRISAYQATDGQLFDDKKQCAEHQRALNIADGLKTIGDRMDNDPELYSEDAGGYHIIETGEQFAKFVMAHADDIKLALAGKPIGVIEQPIV